VTGVLDRFLVRETLKSFLGVLAILAVVIAAHGLMRLLRSVAAGIIDQAVLLRLIGLGLFDALGPMLAPAFFLSILLALGRMYRDNEMTALLASGVSPWRVFRSFLLLALPLTLVVGWITFDLKPQIKHEQRQIRAEQKQTTKLSAALAGQFNEFEKGGLVFYVEEVSESGGQMRNIFVQHRRHGTLGLVRAETGIHRRDAATGERFVVLNNGHRYEGTPGRADYTVGAFRHYGMRIAKPEPVELERVGFSAQPTEMLLASDELGAKAEIQYRLSYPLSVLVFTVLAFPLSRSLPRQGVYGRLVTAFLVYFLYMNLMEVSGTWMRAGATPAWLGRWWVHALMLMTAGIVLALDSSWWAGWRRRHRLGRAGA
jgi:lipopolysaccharide export system permease protein